MMAGRLMVTGEQGLLKRLIPRVAPVLFLISR
jgi:hypothetical protein